MLITYIYMCLLYIIHFLVHCILFCCQVGSLKIMLDKKSRSWSSFCDRAVLLFCWRWSRLDWTAKCCKGLLSPMFLAIPNVSWFIPLMNLFTFVHICSPLSETSFRFAKVQWSQRSSGSRINVTWRWRFWGSNLTTFLQMFPQTTRFRFGLVQEWGIPYTRILWF